MLGSARKVVVTKDETTIIEGAGDAAAIEGRVCLLYTSRRFRSFVRTEEAAPAAPRGAQRIAQRQFVPTIRSEEHERREAFRREKEYARDTLNFTLRLAEAMFHYGADAMDVDSAIIAVSSAYGLDSVEVDITNQSVTINYTSDPDIYMESRIAKRNANAEERFTHTLVRVVRSSTENYDCLLYTSTAGCGR